MSAAPPASPRFDDKFDVTPRGIYRSQSLDPSLMNTFTLSADRTVVEHVKSCPLILYGVGIFNMERTYKWKIKVGWTVQECRFVFFGVVNRHYDPSKAMYATCIDGSYVFHSYSGERNSSGELINDQTYIMENNTAKRIGYGRILSNGDVVDIILDLKHHTLAFAINGKDQGIAVNKVKKAEYNLVISMDTVFGRQTVTILSSEVV